MTQRRLKRVRQGWYRGYPSAETVEAAKAKLAEGDAAKPNDMPNFSERRWQGLLAEQAVHVWLTEEGIEHVWNGGADPKPDFEIAGSAVGVKCCGSMKPWRAGLVVNVYERHRKHELDELLFVGFEHPGAVRKEPTVVILGGLPKPTYFERATEVKAGEHINPDVIAKNHVWNLETGELEPPDEWLQRVVGN